MEVVKQLSNYYGFDMQEALVLLNIQELPISQPDNPTIPCRELNQEEMVVAIGIIIKPILLK